VASNPTHTPVLIVGAGLAGLAAARELQKSGRPFLVTEKSRGLGGRAATRRWVHGPVDHGAQFFTVRSPEFRAQVDDWLSRGLCFEWTRGFHQWTRGGLQEEPSDHHPRFACHNGMSVLSRDLADGCDEQILRNERLVRLAPDGDVWAGEFESGRIIKADAVLLTAPAPQAALLLGEAAPEAATSLASHTMSPCLALAARYARQGLPWRGIQFAGHPVLSWVGHDTSKRPDSHRGSTILVLHANPEFSEANYTAPPEEMTATMLAALSEATGADFANPTDTFFHRWRYSQAVVAAGAATGVLSWSGPAPLLVAGDAVGGGKIEGAWLSGRAAGRKIIGG